MKMDLNGSKFFVLFPICFVYIHIITFAQGSTHKYSQEEIDEAWSRMVEREKFLAVWNNQTGCWTNNYIPYIIRDGFKISQVRNIYSQMNQIQNKTCIRFVDEDKFTVLHKMVEFKPYPPSASTCHTQEKLWYNKKHEVKGVSVTMHLGRKCFIDESVIHEMLHVLGLLHEHQRIDRDCYVEVSDWSWIRENNQFKIIYNDLSFERWPYDKRSIVHYNREMFVIKDKDERWWSLPWNYRLGDSYGFFGRPRGHLSTMDVQKLNYRFCKGPDYCDIHPIRCDEIEQQENESGCKQLYMDIANGVVKPTNKKD